MPETTRRSKPAAKDDQSNQDLLEDVWSRPNWPPRLEKAFVGLLIEEMNNVDVIPSSFREEMWDRVSKVFNEETGLNYDKLELKKHLAVLRKRYRIVKPLYDHGGFGWDYRRKMVEVDDDIWKEYIEVHPAIKPYRKFGCPIYDDLCTIFTKSLATGEHAISIGGGSIWPARGRSDNPVGRNKRQRAQPLSSVPNKRTHKDSHNSKPSTTLQTDSASKLKGAGITKSDEDPYSASQCISILNGMQGVDRRLYNAALDLFQNPVWRKTFISLKIEKRLIWLKAMLPSA